MSLIVHWNRPPVANEVQEGGHIYAESIITNIDGEMVYEKDHKLCDLHDGHVGTVKIVVDREPICVPGNATLTVSRNASKINTSQLYIVEEVAHHDLQSGLVVNSCCITQRPGRSQ